MGKERGENKNKPFIAIPCDGIVDIKGLPITIPRDHVYKVMKNSSERDLMFEDEFLIGWMPLDRAIKKYGEDKIYIRTNSRVCPVCFDLGYTSYEAIRNGTATIEQVIGKYRGKIVGIPGRK